MKDLPRSGRPRVTSNRDDRALQRLVRRMPFATSPVLKQHWLPNRRLSTRTVRNRLKSAGLKSRRVIKRPLLVDRHRRTRLAWCLARRGWNLRTWRKIQGFKLGGAHLKKLRRVEGGAKIVGVFRVKNHDFTQKKSYFFQLRREARTFFGYFV